MKRPSTNISPTIRTVSRNEAFAISWFESDAPGFRPGELLSSSGDQYAGNDDDTANGLHQPDRLRQDGPGERKAATTGCKSSVREEGRLAGKASA